MRRWIRLRRTNPIRVPASITRARASMAISSARSQRVASFGAVSELEIDERIGLIRAEECQKHEHRKTGPKTPRQGAGLQQVLPARFLQLKIDQQHGKNEHGKKSESGGILRLPLPYRQRRQHPACFPDGLG